MERVDSKAQKTGKSGATIIGAVLVVAGFLMIGDQLELFPFRLRSIIFSWQTILIVLGLILVTNREARLTGIILLCIGIFFLLPHFSLLPVSTRKLFWPALMVLIGIYILSKRSYRRGLSYSASSGNGNAIEDVHVFAGHDRIIQTDNFSGGEIVNVFGGGNYDMRQAKLGPGNNVLDIVMIFGGSKIIVPQDWDVKVRVSAVFGGFSDKRIKSPEIKRDTSRTLIIKGIAIFGGGELTNFD